MIRATERMIAELGPDAVTIREVARRAGVSSGAPFHHFPTRQALMTALAEEATHELRQCVEDAVAEIPEAKAYRRLRAIGRAWLLGVVNNPARFQVAADRRLTNGAEPIQRDNAAIQGLIRDTLSRAAKPGKRTLDIDQAILEMRAMAYGLARLFADGHVARQGGNEARTLEHLAAAFEDFLARLLGR